MEKKLQNIPLYVSPCRWVSSVDWGLFFSALYINQQPRSQGGGNEVDEPVITSQT